MWRVTCKNNTFKRETFQCALTNFFANINPGDHSAHTCTKKKKKRTRKSGEVDRRITNAVNSYLNSFQLCRTGNSFKLMQFIKIKFIMFFQSLAQKTCDSNFLKASQKENIFYGVCQAKLKNFLQKFMTSLKERKTSKALGGVLFCFAKIFSSIILRLNQFTKISRSGTVT